MLSKRIIQLLLAVSCIGLVNVSCAQQRIKVPTHGTPQGAEAVIDVIKRAPLSIVISPEGDAAMVGKGLTQGEQCYKTEVEAKRNQGKLCSTFNKERVLQDVQTFTVLKSKGSFIYCYVDGNGNYRQICFDDNWKQITCP